MEDLRQRTVDPPISTAHRIDFHILFVVTGGEGHHMVDFTDYPAQPGTLIWIAPGQVHRFDGGNALRGYLVLFQPEVCGVDTPHRRWPTATRPAPADFELLETLSALISSLDDRGLSTPPDRLAWRMLGAVLELWEGAAAHRANRRDRPFGEALDAFETLLEAHFASHRTVAWYARRLGYSDKTLTRWCRQATGAGAKATIDRRVALEAKRLLVHTELSIDTIGDRLGFSESTNFVKFFKRTDGQTPMQFRSAFEQADVGPHR